jgi:hypothetical protein
VPISVNFLWKILSLPDALLAPTFISTIFFNPKSLEILYHTPYSYYIIIRFSKKYFLKNSNVESLNITCNMLNNTNFDFSLFFKTFIHFPRVNKEVLIFPASLNRSPSFCVFTLRSEPARSHKDNQNQPKRKKQIL